MKTAYFINALANEAELQSLIHALEQVPGYLYLYGPAVGLHDSPLWRPLLGNLDISLNICVSAALRYGVLNELELRLNDHFDSPQQTPSGFHIVGLADWWMHALRAESIIQNGSERSKQETAGPAILISLSQAAYDTYTTEEGIECALAAGALEQSVGLFFSGESVEALKKSTPVPPDRKAFMHALKAASLYNIKTIFVCEDAAKKFKLEQHDLLVPVELVELVSTQDMAALRKTYSVTLDF